MKHQCPYCFTDTESRRGLHSHLMQKKSCREHMEADAYTSESTTNTSNDRNNSNSPIQHANELENYPCDNEADEVTADEVTAAASPQVATATSPQPPSSPNPLSTVGDADDDSDADDNNQTRWIEEFPHPAGVPIGEGVSCFEEWRRDQKGKKEQPWSPFESREEWELAQWLITSGISQKKIDSFLKLKMVRVSQNIMKSCSQLRFRLRRKQTPHFTTVDHYSN